MKKWQVPSLLEFAEPADFFRRMVEVNRGVASFSQRNLAKKVGWPVSYFPDLLKGRKRLTVARAIEFANYFTLDPLSLERLIFWALEAQVPGFDGVAGLSARRLRARRSEPTKDWELLNAKVLLIFESVRWFRGRATAELIAKQLRRAGLSTKDVTDALRALESKGLIESADGAWRALVATLHTDDYGFPDDAAFHRDCATFFLRFLDEKIGPAIYNSSFIHLPASKFEELADRVVALRNWIAQQSAAESARAEAGDSVIFQMDLNLFPFFKRTDKRA